MFLSVSWRRLGPRVLRTASTSSIAFTHRGLADLDFRRSSFETKYKGEVAEGSRTNPVIRLLSPGLPRFRWAEAYHQTRCSLLDAAIAVRLAACGKTLFATLEQRGVAVLVVTKPLDSHRLTPFAAERLMPSAPPFPPKGKSVRYAFGGTFPRDE